jgi:hypothetical protein
VKKNKKKTLQFDSWCPRLLVSASFVIMYLPRHCREDRAWDGVLSVPFEQKDTAKALGAVWDTTRRVWVVPPALRVRRAEFEAWDKNIHSTKTQLAAAPKDEAECSALELKRARITRELLRALCGTHV